MRLTMWHAHYRASLPYSPTNKGLYIMQTFIVCAIIVVIALALPVLLRFALLLCSLANRIHSEYHQIKLREEELRILSFKAQQVLVPDNHSLVILGNDGLQLA